MSSYKRPVDSMVSLQPTSPPPPYHSSESSLMVHPAHPRAQAFTPPYPIEWTLDDFCRELYLARTDCSLLGILSVQYRKRLHQGFQHELLILDVIPVKPTLSAPKDNPSHIYLEVGRFKDHEHISFKLGGIVGPAKDKIVVIGQGDVALHEPKCNLYPERGEILATMSWKLELPNLVDFFDVIKLLSVMFPYYDPVIRQCYWFASTIYDVLQAVYSRHQLEDRRVAFWKRAKFLVFFRLLTPPPPPALVSFCRYKRDSNFYATAVSISNHDVIGGGLLADSSHRRRHSH
ncbi:hypothetical protein OG21DRAFT_1516437 [Imleria badia]|nr:hypothetical protein OG21DRAFT_1516437 [Imleria badia]